jgi:hypothetical protein
MEEEGTWKKEGRWVGSKFHMPMKMQQTSQVRSKLPTRAIGLEGFALNAASQPIQPSEPR